MLASAIMGRVDRYRMLEGTTVADFTIREPLIAGGKFVDPDWTADGKPRATVSLERLETLWFNTGTLCNLACENCYIESTPRNDRLVYLTRAEVRGYLDEIEALGLGTSSLGFTGGEPFMNPAMLDILEDGLARGYEVLVLSNAMKPMWHRRAALVVLNQRFPGQLTIRVSVDHYRRELHEEERGPRSWQPTLDGLRWLCTNGFGVHVAGRTRWGDSEAELRRGFAALFAREGISVDADDRRALLLFPEMDPAAAVPEITTECWSLLGVDPGTVMCATSRMVVKHKGAAHPTVVSCTLLPYDPRFALHDTLAGALGTVALNHPHCAKFCVLGGGSCTA